LGNTALSRSDANQSASAKATPPQREKNHATATESGEDRTAIDLFIDAVRDWEADLQRHFSGTPKS
jgi:hypothetical protein